MGITSAPNIDEMMVDKHVHVHSNMSIIVVYNYWQGNLFIIELAFNSIHLPFYFFSENNINDFLKIAVPQ